MGLTIVLAALALVGPFARASDAANYLNLDLRQDRYLGEVQHSSQEPNYTQLNLRVNLEPARETYFDYKLNARAQGTLETKDETYFGVPELYGGTNTYPLGVTLGRKKRHWSHLDEDFHLGLWQPEIRWDYLAPEQEGLTGAFIQYQASSAVHLLLFTSPINIPDQGPQYRLENGQFYSSNRWFQQPTNAIRLFHGTPYASAVPLYFEIDRPSDQQLFFNPSLGGAIDYDSQSGFFLHTAYAYMPRNQIHLGIECSNCANLSAPVPLEITAVIHPKVIMHHIATVESGYTDPDQSGYISLTGEFPDRSHFPADYEESQLQDSLIAGASYQHYIGTWLFGCPNWLGYSYLRAFDLKTKSQDSILKQDQVQSSMDRYPLQNVAAFDWKIRLNQSVRNRVNWVNRYMYSIPEQGAWLSSQFEWTQGQVGWLLGADILGSNVEPTSDRAGLFTRYRANDRVFGGVNYVF